MMEKGGRRRGFFRMPIRQVFQWMTAFIIAMLLLNCVCFFYCRPAGWIERTNSATNAIRNPGAKLYSRMEGKGVYTIDRNGYLNPDKALAKEGYALIVGASHTVGKEVLAGQRFSDILNDRLAVSKNELAVYNCSQEGYYFPNIAKNFKAIVREFPGAKSIVIEIGSTNFTKTELMDSLHQGGFDQTQLGCNIVNTLSQREKLVMKVKEAFPVLCTLSLQYNTYQENKLAVIEEQKPEWGPYKRALGKALSLIRSEFSGKIVIVYHPPVGIEADGTMSIAEGDTDALFAELCEENDIEFINMSDAFLRAYQTDYSVPYGFSNTVMGAGHLNATGHKLIAEALYETLQGRDTK